MSVVVFHSLMNLVSSFEILGDFLTFPSLNYYWYELRKSNVIVFIIAWFLVYLIISLVEGEWTYEM